MLAAEEWTRHLEQFCQQHGLGRKKIKPIKVEIFSEAPSLVGPYFEEHFDRIQVFDAIESDRRPQQGGPIEYNGHVVKEFLQAAPKAHLFVAGVVKKGGFLRDLAPIVQVCCLGLCYDRTSS